MHIMFLLALISPECCEGCRANFLKLYCLMQEGQYYPKREIKERKRKLFSEMEKWDWGKKKRSDEKVGRKETKRVSKQYFTIRYQKSSRIIK